MEKKNEFYLNGGYADSEVYDGRYETGLTSYAPHTANGLGEKHTAEAALELAEKQNPEEPIDPWTLPEYDVKAIPWKALDGKGKAKRVLWDYFFRQVAILGFLYLFVCSLDFLSVAFRLIGGDAVGLIFSSSAILSNPVTGVMIGVVATVLLQSSSTTTSIVVAMVGTNTLDVESAIPIIMGANIGTSVTSTLVSLGQAQNRNDFRRAFGGATVHDLFNWLTVLILVPVEAASHYLLISSNYTVNSFNLPTTKTDEVKFLQVITDPFTKLVIQVDKTNLVLKSTNYSAYADLVLAKKCYKTTLQTEIITSLSTNLTTNVTTNVSEAVITSTTKRTCEYLFMDVAGVWGDEVIGGVLLAISIVMLSLCLVGLVKILQATLKGTVASVLKKIVGANVPSKVGAYFTGYFYIVIGTGFTILLQSSSVFTSALTPLVGLGVLPIERAYALTLGSNVGTTATAILAAFAGDELRNSLQIALCHLYFNLSGILLWFVIPFMRIPIPLAKKLGDITANYRWFAIAYIIGMFLIFPGLIFALSIPAPPWVLVGVAGPIALVILIVAIINVIQNKRPGLLPKKLQTWDFLPLWMRSLQPIDGVFKRCCCKCCCRDHEQGLKGQGLESQGQERQTEECKHMNGNLEMKTTFNSSAELLSEVAPPAYAKANGA